MEYKYILEEKANKNLTFNDLLNNKGFCILNLLCYHVENQHKYPFLQFMMEKIPFCNNIVKEQLILPYIIIQDSSINISELVLEKVKHSLDLLGCESNRITDDMFKGILYIENCNTPFVLVNISGIDIYGLNFMRKTRVWFALPSEIINLGSICNIPIDKEINNLFTDFPSIGLLSDPKTETTYSLPDAVYTGSELKESEFQSIFGISKKKIYESCGDYYYFYRTFGDAVKDGGWLNNNNNKSGKIGNRIIVDNDSNKYFIGCINRYALFVEGKIYTESTCEFILTDNLIESLYPEPCIIISYSGKHNTKPDLLVKNLESFVCISYHKLDKNLLDEYFEESNKNQYMIA